GEDALQVTRGPLELLADLDLLGDLAELDHDGRAVLELDPHGDRVGEELLPVTSPVRPLPATAAVDDGVLDPGDPHRAAVLLRLAAHVVGLERLQLLER